MQFIILGAGSGLPHPDYHLSSLIFQTSEGNFLVDCGEGVSRQLLKQGYNGNFLDAVIISHYHPDHISGIYMLLQMLSLEGRTKPLSLYLPERAAEFMETLHMFYTFEQRFKFELKVYEVSEIEEHYTGVAAAMSDHLYGYEEFINKHHYHNMMQSYSFAFTDNAKKVVYTSDITTFHNIHPLFEKADIIVIDAMHPKADLIVALAASNQARIILTHGLSASMNTWLTGHPNHTFEFAKENNLYQP